MYSPTGSKCSYELLLLLLLLLWPAYRIILRALAKPMVISGDREQIVVPSLLTTAVWPSFGSVLPAEAGSGCRCGGLRVCSSHQTVLSTRRHQPHPVSVPILHPREIQALWSQNHDTEIRHCNGCSRVDNAMTCHRTGYDTYTQKLAIQMR